MRVLNFSVFSQYYVESKRYNNLDFAAILRINVNYILFKYSGHS